MSTEPHFSYYRSRSSDKPMACRVFVADHCIGFVWRSWDRGSAPVWVTRLTQDGPDLSIEPTKKAAAMVLWRIAAVREEQSAQAERMAVPA